MTSRQAPKTKQKKPLQHRNLAFFRRVILTQEMNDAKSERATAIIGAALVENNLALAILERLRPMSGDDQRALFEADAAPLQDLHAKIEIGFALGLYGQAVRDDLTRIRKIRNKFAHDLDVSSFDHLAVSKYCDQLKGVDFLSELRATYERPRLRRFTDLVAYFIQRFSDEAKDTHRPPGWAHGHPDY